MLVSALAAGRTMPTACRGKSESRGGAARASTSPGLDVLCSDDPSALTQRLVQGLVRSAPRRANLRSVGVHVLRPTFCSHLAMRGAAARAIQELAGHQDLTTTQRYLRLTPRRLMGAIRLLDDGSAGDVVETGENGR